VLLVNPDKVTEKLVNSRLTRQLKSRFTFVNFAQEATYPLASMSGQALQVSLESTFQVRDRAGSLADHTWQPQCSGKAPSPEKRGTLRNIDKL
jgi:hypothetical protein